VQEDRNNPCYAYGPENKAALFKAVQAARKAYNLPG